MRMLLFYYPKIICTKKLYFSIFFKLSQKTKNSVNFNNLLSFGADGRNRTGTRFNPRRILSPVRLPVPPHLHECLATDNAYYNTFIYNLSIQFFIFFNFLFCICNFLFYITLVIFYPSHNFYIFICF